MHFDEWLLGVVDLVWFGLDFPFFYWTIITISFLTILIRIILLTTNIGDNTAAMQWVTISSLCLCFFVSPYAKLWCWKIGTGRYKQSRQQLGRIKSGWQWMFRKCSAICDNGHTTRLPNVGKANETIQNLGCSCPAFLLPSVPTAKHKNLVWTIPRIYRGP